MSTINDKICFTPSANIDDVKFGEHASDGKKILKIFFYNTRWSMMTYSIYQIENWYYGETELDELIL